MREDWHLESSENYHVYILLNDKYEMSLKYALKQESKMRANLLKTKRLVMLLDLDNTLVHATQYSGSIRSPTYYGKFDKA